MALMGHSGSHSVQSMHSSGSITRKLGPSWKQSTGQTSTQSVYLHLMQFSVTTKGMRFDVQRRKPRKFKSPRHPRWKCLPAVPKYLLAIGRGTAHPLRRRCAISVGIVPAEAMRWVDPVLYFHKWNDLLVLAAFIPSVLRIMLHASPHTGAPP